MTTILNSARRSSVNVSSNENVGGPANVSGVADTSHAPFGKSKTSISSGNPFRQSDNGGTPAAAN